MADVWAIRFRVFIYFSLVIFDFWKSGWLTLPEMDGVWRSVTILFVYCSKKKTTPRWFRIFLLSFVFEATLLKAFILQKTLKSLVKTVPVINSRLPVLVCWKRKGKKKRQLKRHKTFSVLFSKICQNIPCSVSAQLELLSSRLYYVVYFCGKSWKIKRRCALFNFSYVNTWGNDSKSYSISALF